MEPIFYISNKCRFCQSKELELVLPLAPSPMCDKYLHKKQFQEIFPLDLFLCKDCGLSQITCVVDPEYIYKDYKERTNRKIVRNIRRHLWQVRIIRVKALPVIRRPSVRSESLVFSPPLK